MIRQIVLDYFSARYSTALSAVERGLFFFCDLGHPEQKLPVIGEQIVQGILRQHPTPRTALAYLVFALLYFPCIATIVAVASESGSWRYGFFVAAYTTAIAYVMSALVAWLL